MNKNLIILGAGGHGRVVKETAELMGTFDKVDFLDDNSNVAIGTLNEVIKFKEDYSHAFVAFGDNQFRREWQKKLASIGFQIPILRHPSAYVSNTAKIEHGTVICANAVINVNTVVKEGCIISIGALLDHDCKVGEFSHINVGVIVTAGSFIKPSTKLDWQQLR
ncbi:hypothetical protein [Alkalihalobacillus sp. LMS39]|uniref:PglD-related sugar-binding protein n=1 Tax=Alkalihalobacillus sp. LMS39 TaxID=2924032 RepID=UPI001FB37E4D|nr:hypothetical protein [Alkalihalobacillus sp. LMS39]UOE93875.1 hypothetical protein MM271_22325 [Alkalihalobacillus sp. LMS39]